SHLSQDELRVQEHHVPVHALARLGEQLDRLGLGELDADLGDDPPPAAVEHPDRVGGEDLIPRHRVDEHRSAFPARAPNANQNAGPKREPKQSKEWNLTDIRPASYDHIVELRLIKWNIL